MRKIPNIVQFVTNANLNFRSTLSHQKNYSFTDRNFDHVFLCSLWMMNDLSVYILVPFLNSFCKKRLNSIALIFLWLISISNRRIKWQKLLIDVITWRSIHFLSRYKQWQTWFRFYSVQFDNWLIDWSRKLWCSIVNGQNSISQMHIFSLFRFVKWKQRATKHFQLFRSDSSKSGLLCVFCTVSFEWVN